MNNDQPVVPPATTETELDRESRPIPFWRTVLIVIAHWVLQVVFYLVARNDSEQLSWICFELICADTLIHILILCSFAGMVLRSRFLFSWSFGFVLLNYILSLVLSHLAVDHWTIVDDDRKQVQLLHIIIAISGGVCLVFWPVFRWKYELVRYSAEKIRTEKKQFQFSIGWLFYLTLVVAIVTIVLCKINSDEFRRTLPDEYIMWGMFSVFWITWIISLYLMLLPAISHWSIVHINVISIFIVIWLFYLGSKPAISPTKDLFKFMIVSFGMGFVFLVTCLAYRWAGWRVVRRADPNKSINIESFLQQRP